MSKKQTCGGHANIIPVYIGKSFYAKDGYQLSPLVGLKPLGWFIIIKFSGFSVKEGRGRVLAFMEDSLDILCHIFTRFSHFIFLLHSVPASHQLEGIFFETVRSENLATYIVLSSGVNTILLTPMVEFYFSVKLEHRTFYLPF